MRHAVLAAVLAPGASDRHFWAPHVAWRAELFAFSARPGRRRQDWPSTEFSRWTTKGPGWGAIVYTAHDIFDGLTGEPLANLRSAEFLRDDGGYRAFGCRTQIDATPGRRRRSRQPFAIFVPEAVGPPLPSSQPRLHADPPADPDIAKEAGFDRPICSMASTLSEYLPGGPQALRAAKAGGRSPRWLCASHRPRSRQHDPG